MTKSINCKGKLLDLEYPVVMGILNATPDSFYKGYLGSSNDQIVSLAGKMIEDGAAIIDIGGQSTRPGSQRISVAEEADRVLPVIELVKAAFPAAIISIDSYQSTVVRDAVNAGASIVNDISAGTMDDNMLDTVAALQTPYICMHMLGTPSDMQNDPRYDDVVKDVLDFFILRTDQCRAAGIKDVIIDPGFGFGKTIGHNFQLLKNLQVLSLLDQPLLVGLSRKSTIYKTLGITADEALNGTTVLHTLALQHCANLLRVHDVKEAREAVLLYTAYKKAP